MRKNLLLFFSLLAFYSCDIYTGKLILINETENVVYYQLEVDTVPFVPAGKDLNLQFFVLHPNDTIKPAFFITRSNEWAFAINQMGIDSSLHIFIFPTYQVTHEMIKNREYVRLSYTVKELDSLNWTVVYRGKNEIEE